MPSIVRPIVPLCPGEGVGSAEAVVVAEEGASDAMAL
jgi:hypothetical protein